MIGKLGHSVGPTPLRDEFTERGARPDLVVGAGEKIHRTVYILNFDTTSVAIVSVRHGFSVYLPGRENGPAARLERRMVADRMGPLTALDCPGCEP